MSPRAAKSRGRARVSRAVAVTDYTRRSPATVGGPGAHKEWQHFVVFSPTVDALINFSLADVVGPRRAPRGEQARLILLVRTDRWTGEVESFPAGRVRAPGGQITLAFGGNRLRFEDGRFAIQGGLPDQRVTVDLTLRPVTLPAFVPSVPMLEGPPLHWVTVPRLVAEGTIRVSDRSYGLSNGLAYHDHNWGRYWWGHDVAWEWGFVLPEDGAIPWTLTFVRLTNRARTAALAQKVLLWRGAEAVRVFREEDTAFEASLSRFPRAPAYRIPRALGLVASASLADVPARLTVRGRLAGDWLECRSEPSEVVQVLIPSEVDLGLTVFNEVLAATTVRGEVGGTKFAYRGRSILEFIRVEPGIV